MDYLITFITSCLCFDMLCSMSVQNTRWTNIIVLQYHSVIALYLDNHSVTALFMNSAAHEVLIKGEERSGVGHSHSQLRD